MKLAFAAQMKEMDRVAIEERGIPSLDLMERAAEGIADVVGDLAGEQGISAGREKKLFLPEVSGEILIGDCRRTWKKTPGQGERRVAVFVGPGNNGGDGVAAARLLKERGWDAAVFLVGDRSRLTPDTAAMERRLAEVGLTLRPFPTDTTDLCEMYAWCAGCDVFVDALFGVGLCREVSGLFALAIALMNTYNDIPTVSADIASGLHADTGKVLGCAVRAAATVTFSLAKPGQFVDQGALYTGRLIVHDIGIPEEVIATQTLNVESIDAVMVKEALPSRRADGHKGDFGKDYILAGSVGFTGAPVLAAHACARMGAGLVTVGTPSSAWGVVAGKCLEEMAYPLPEQNGKLSAAAYEGIMEKLRGCDAALIGPGLGRSEESDALLCRLVSVIQQPLLLDADGINALCAHMDSLYQRAGRVTVLTPHDGEFARLGGDLEQTDRLSAAQDFAKRWDCVLVLKGHRTIVAAPDGRAAVNTTGNSGMAKGGSGDALSGMLLALLGQGVEPYAAACAAVWLHGRAGDRAAQELGEVSMLPADLIGQIAAAVMELQGR